MSTAHENQSVQPQLSGDAFLAYNRIGGLIRERCLQILREKIGGGVASKNDVEECYWQACQEILHRPC